MPKKLFKVIIGGSYKPYELEEKELLERIKKGWIEKKYNPITKTFTYKDLTKTVKTEKIINNFTKKNITRKLNNLDVDVLNELLEMNNTDFKGLVKKIYNTKWEIGRNSNYDVEGVRIANHSNMASYGGNNQSAIQANLVFDNKVKYVETLVDITKETSKETLKNVSSNLSSKVSSNSNVKYWTKRAGQRLSDSEQFTSEYLKLIHDNSEKAKKDIDRLIQNVYKNYSNETGLDIEALKQKINVGDIDNYGARITRLEQQKRLIDERIKSFANTEAKLSKDLYTSLLNGSYNSFINDYTGFTSFNGINDRLVKQILNNNWKNSNYSKRIWKNKDQLSNKLQEVLHSGALTGASNAYMSKEIRNAFDVDKFYSDRLVRTESNYFHNQAELEALKEMGYTKYIFSSILDNRTSAICQEMDAQVIEVKDAKVGENLPPLHPNCRSTILTYLGDDLMPLQRYNAVTGELIDYMSYKDYENKALANIDKLITKDKILNVSDNIVYTNYGVNYDLKSLKWLNSEMLETSINQLEYLSNTNLVVSNDMLSNGGLNVISGNHKSGAIGYMSNDNKEMFLSSKYMSNKASYIKLMDSQIKYGWKMPILKVNYAKYTQSHEWGHAVENYIMKTKGTNANKIKHDIIDIAIKQSGKTKKEVLALMSDYGKTKDVEFFAEAFTMSQLGKQDHVIAKAMNEYLKGVF